jgi:hypothetical protein
VAHFKGLSLSSLQCADRPTQLIHYPLSREQPLRIFNMRDVIGPSHSDSRVEQRETVANQATDGIETRQLHRIVFAHFPQRIDRHGDIGFGAPVGLEKDFLPSQQISTLTGFCIDSTRKQLIGPLDNRVAVLDLADVPDDAAGLLISESANQENENRRYHGERATL